MLIFSLFHHVVITLFAIFELDDDATAAPLMIRRHAAYRLRH